MILEDLGDILVKGVLEVWVDPSVAENGDRLAEVSQKENIVGYSCFRK